jgi:PPOX class probable F420-dependent enzyme
MAEISEGTRSFLNEVRFAVVSTIAADGTPHQTVMWYRLDGDALLLNMSSGSLKHKHMKRDPRLSVCVADGYRYVTLVGRVTLDENPDTGGAAYRALGQRYAGTFTERPQTPPSDPRVQAMLSRPRVMIRMEIDKVIANGV